MQFEIVYWLTAFVVGIIVAALFVFHDKPKGEDTIPATLFSGFLGALAGSAWPLVIVMLIVGCCGLGIWKLWLAATDKQSQCS